MAELRAGRKQTHWSWYILPQLQGLGSSPMSVRYAITNLQEARAYLAHPVLGRRLRECIAAIGEHKTRSVEQILGRVDAMKFHSCLTLFAHASESHSEFHAALREHFGGVEDPSTARMLAIADAEPGPATLRSGK